MIYLKSINQLKNQSRASSLVNFVTIDQLALKDYLLKPWQCHLHACNNFWRKCYHSVNTCYFYDTLVTTPLANVAFIDVFWGHLMSHVKNKLPVITKPANERTRLGNQWIFCLCLYDKRRYTKINDET